MHEPADNLVNMANQIGGFFAAQAEGDTESAARSVASHLKLFWAPMMRADLLATVQRGGGQGLLPVVQLALRRYAAQLLAGGARIPAEADEVFPQGGGDAG